MDDGKALGAIARARTDAVCDARARDSSTMKAPMRSMDIDASRGGRGWWLGRARARGEARWVGRGEALGLARDARRGAKPRTDAWRVNGARDAMDLCAED